MFKQQKSQHDRIIQMLACNIEEIRLRPHPDKSPRRIHLQEVLCLHRAVSLEKKKKPKKGFIRAMQHLYDIIFM